MLRPDVQSLEGTRERRHGLPVSQKILREGEGDHYAVRTNVLSQSSRHFKSKQENCGFPKAHDLTNRDRDLGFKVEMQRFSVVSLGVMRFLSETICSEGVQPHILERANRSQGRGAKLRAEHDLRRARQPGYRMDGMPSRVHSYDLPDTRTR